MCQRIARFAVGGCKRDSECERVLVVNYFGGRLSVSKRKLCRVSFCVSAAERHIDHQCDLRQQQDGRCFCNASIVAKPVRKRQRVLIG